MKTRLFLFTVLVMNCLTGFSQKHLWSSQFGIADVETSAKSMAIDADNNVYLTGCFTGAEMTIGDKEITGTSTVMDAYIAKFTPNKQCVFASSIKSTSGSVVIQSVATDASGSSYVVGNFESDAQISETFKIESDYKDFLIAKYDATGNPVWLKGTASGIEPVIKSIAVNQNDGSFVITGAFTGNLNMDINGGNSEISSGDSELAFFIAKYDSNANLIWTKTMSGSGTGTGNLISVDEEGGIYAAGTFSGTIQFGTQSMTAASVENTDNFLIKYSADGNLIWARSLTGSKLDDINAMDVAGNQVVIGGVIRSEDLVVDNAPEVTMKTLDTSGSWNSMLIVSFDTNGNYQWNYIAGSINQPTDVKTVAIDKDGSIWNAGTSFGTYYFNPDTEDEARQFPSKAKGGQDMYLMKLSSRGEVLIGHRVGDATREGAMAMVVGNEGLLYVADMISTRSGGTASPVNLFGDPITIPTIGSNYSVALLCYQQIYATPAVLPVIKPGMAFSQVINAENANGDAEFTLYYGTLPEGLNLNPATGELSGTSTTTGIYPIVISMKDADGNVGFAEYTLTVSTGTGLKDYQQEAIRVWGDHGAIEVSTSTSNCRVMIFDLSGRLIIQNRLKGNDRYTVDNGIYTVVVEDSISGKKSVHKASVY